MKRSFVRIGGVDQWIQVRGEHRGNPVILFLHGGPGFTAIPYFQRVHAHLGARLHDRALGSARRGQVLRSQRRSAAAQPTLDQMITDGIEVAEHVRRRLHQPKMILVGYSWGSVLGVEMARVRPDLFYAFVGTGQVMDTVQSEPASYYGLLQRARAAGDERIGCDADRDRAAALCRRRAARPQRGILGAVSARRGSGSSNQFRTLLLAPGYSLRDVADVYFFAPELTRELLAVMLKYKVTDRGSTFGLPLFFFRGTDDPWTSPEVVKGYLPLITAPHKEIVLFDRVGHHAVEVSGERFLKELNARVRPLVQQPSMTAQSPAAMSWFRRNVVPGLVFKAAVIGGAYSTGRELAEFFAPHGPWGGLVAILCAMLVWSVTFAVSLEFARLTRSFDYKTFFEQLIGRGWVIIEMLMLVLLFLIVSVVEATASEMLRALAGVPNVAGTVLFSCGVAALLVLGTQRIETLISGWSFVLYGFYALFLVLALSQFRFARCERIPRRCTGRSGVLVARRAALRRLQHRRNRHGAVYGEKRHDAFRGSARRRAGRTARDAAGAAVLHRDDGLLPGSQRAGVAGQFPHGAHWSAAAAEDLPVGDPGHAARHGSDGAALVQPAHRTCTAGQWTIRAARGRLAHSCCGHAGERRRLHAVRSRAAGREGLRLHRARLHRLLHRPDPDGGCVAHLADARDWDRYVSRANLVGGTERERCKCRGADAGTDRSSGPTACAIHRAHSRVPLDRAAVTGTVWRRHGCLGEAGAVPGHRVLQAARAR